MESNPLSTLFNIPPGMAPPQVAGAPNATQAPAAPGLAGGFEQLLQNQDAVAGLLQKLKLVMPSGEFAQLQAEVNNGNLLPLAEIVAALGGPQQVTEGIGVAPVEVKPPPLAQAMASSQSDQSAEATPNAEEKSDLPVLPVDEFSWVPEHSPNIGPFEPAGIHFRLGVEADPQSTITPIIPPPAVAGQHETATKSVLPEAVLNRQLLGEQRPMVSPQQGSQPNPELPTNPGSGKGGVDFAQQMVLERNRAIEVTPVQAAKVDPAQGLMRAIIAEREGSGLQLGTAGNAGQGNHLGLGQLLNPAASPIPAAMPIQAQPYTSLSTAPTPMPIDIPVGHKGWERAMGERILWMAGNQVQGAEVKLSPAHLGPIDIRISIQNDQATVAFAAQHGAVREALEASIPRLREMLGESNLQLVDVDVGQREAKEQRAHSELNGRNPYQGLDGEDQEHELGLLDPSEPQRYYRQQGLLDAFA